jgi:hypothetical protein
VQLSSPPLFEKRYPCAIAVYPLFKKMPPCAICGRADVKKHGLAQFTIPMFISQDRVAKMIFEPEIDQGLVFFIKMHLFLRFNYFILILV